MSNYQREVNLLNDFIFWQFIFSLNNDGRRESVSGFAFWVLGLGNEDAVKTNADPRFSAKINVKEKIA